MLRTTAVVTVKHPFKAQFSFSETRAVYEILWESVVEPDRPQMTIYYGTEKIGYACRKTKTLVIFNTFCFSTARAVTHTRLPVTSHNIPVLLRLSSIPPRKYRDSTRH